MNTRLIQTAVWTCMMVLGLQKIHGQVISSNQKVGVVEVDVIGLDLEPRLAGEMLRREVMKLNLFNVADSYDQQYILDRNDIKLGGCYSVYCLQEIAEAFEVDKILTGTITRINKSVIITVKIFDTKTKGWQRMSTDTYNDIPDQLTSMIAFTLRQLLEQDFDKEMYRRLTSDVSFYKNVELMEKEEANLSGPRFGVGYLMGAAGEVMTAPKEKGGLGGLPLVSHIGYQFEKVFISSGNTHALVEFLPIISGVEQGTVIPSLNILLGMRNSKSGWELGLGYNFAVGKKKVIEKNDPLDYQYKFAFTSGLLVAVGKTFKSGRLNFPVNIYYIPGVDNSHRMGITLGFNIPRS